MYSVIDKNRAESEKHRTAARRRRSTTADTDDDNTDEIVGVYASHDEVNTTAIALRQNTNYE